MYKCPSNIKKAHALKAILPCPHPPNFNTNFVVQD